MTQKDRATVRDYLAFITPFIDTEKIRSGQYPRAITMLSDTELITLSSFDTTEIYRVLEVFKTLYRNIMLEVVASMSEEQWKNKAIYLSQVSGIDLVLKLPPLAKKEIEDRAKHKFNKK